MRGRRVEISQFGHLDVLSLFERLDVPSSFLAFNSDARPPVHARGAGLNHERTEPPTPNERTDGCGESPLDVRRSVSAG